MEFDGDEVPAVAAGTSVPRYYCRVRITNVNPNIARECRGYLTKISQVGSSGPFKTILNEPFQLAWSYDDKRDAFDLPRGPHPAMDFAVYELGDSMFFPCLRGGGLPTKFNGLFAAEGTYQFTVLVAGQDVDPITRTFEVAYDGKNWPPRCRLV